MTRDGKIERLPENIERLLDSYNVPAGKMRSEAWEAIFEKIDHKNFEEDSKGRVIQLTLTRVAVAASVLVALMLTSYIYLYRMGNVHVQLARGEHGVVYLPDSSRVTLNAESKITYNKNRWFFDRSVSLTGEALFEVSKGRRFKVVTTGATTTVLGTVFNVFSRNGLVKVTCFEGKVKVVATNSKSQTLLTKGMEAKTMGYALDVNKTQTTKAESKPAWTNNEFFFQNAPLSAVIEELERQFNVDIFLNTDTSRFYTGYFKRTNLDEALNLVCIPLDLKWDYSGEIIVITSK
ncbi:MAG: FecR domain-containing protein [Tenuifilum sp.]|uniref:FecR domain-containing protein n=1 Tax=Tenuifilum sp. TaxID=2760880 RepID=UPI001B4833A4|nr:FecR domain-containing protein [Bacteroidales bacterium]HOK60506.1 FecR domain-containing protein [Tenuifilum sp.]MBP9030479.1 FecR domain-containing protein [Bacteroidales bacterium]HOK85512.1 FecR domain-containing protein [Tenuifilum sp.]HON69995.1 FecR domain-containing protein [Tenuifilum sp.]